MNRSMARRGLNTVAMLIMLGLATAPVFAQKKSQREQDAKQRSADAAKVFGEIMDAPDGGIPKQLIDQAKAIAVFPGVLKAALVFGGREGKGVVSRRTDSGWSAPAFFRLAGGSFGAQVGADKTDYVMLIMNQAGLDKLMADKFEVGGEIGVAAGPVGRETSAATDAQLQAGILTYSRSKGAFIGAALKGTTITPDNDLNRAVYGATAKEVLGGSVNEAPIAVVIFPQTLGRY